MNPNAPSTVRSRPNPWLVLSVIVLVVVVVTLLVIAIVRAVAPAPVAAPPAATSSPSASAPALGPTAVANGDSDSGDAPSNDPRIVSFVVSPTSVSCSSGGPFVPGVSSEPLLISWITTGAEKVFLGVDTDDAQAGPYKTDLPGSGSDGSLQYSCPETHRYTLTIVGAGGAKVSQTVAVTNVGER